MSRSDKSEEAETVAVVVVVVVVARRHGENGSQPPNAAQCDHRTHSVVVEQRKTQALQPPAVVVNSRSRVQHWGGG